MKVLNDLFGEFVVNDKATAIMADIAYSWRVLAICSGTAVLLAYLYLIVIRCIGGIIVWGSIFLIQASLISGGYYTYIQRDEYLEGDEYRDWLLYGAYTIWGIGALFFLCICCCCKAIRLGISVYQTTAQFVASNLRIFALPMISYFVALIWLCIWLVSAVYVMSIGDPKPRPDYEFITEM